MSHVCSWRTQVVEKVRKLGHLPLVKKFLVSVQEKNIQAVNDALNELYIEEEVCRGFTCGLY